MGIGDVKNSGQWSEISGQSAIWHSEASAAGRGESTQGLSSKVVLAEVVAPAG
jgi:hypothetical protein